MKGEINMVKKEFKYGTVIKGKDLKEKVLCMILNEDMKNEDFQCKLGKNEKSSGTFCVFEIKYLFEFISYGIKLAMISIPEDGEIQVGAGKYYVSKLIINDIMDLDEISTWKYLKKNNLINIDENNFLLFKILVQHGVLNAIKYLCESNEVFMNYADFAIVWAAQSGHLDVVKYLYESGKVKSCADIAMRHAKEYGHFEIFEYLRKCGVEVGEK